MRMCATRFLPKLASGMLRAVREIPVPSSYPANERSVAVVYFHNIGEGLSQR